MEISPDIQASLILHNQFLTPSTEKKGKEAIIDVIRSIGGLQWGAEDVSLVARLSDYRAAWIKELIEERELIEVHVLRGGLRIIPADEYPLYFAGTREVIQRVSDRRLHIAHTITPDHAAILEVVHSDGLLTMKEIKKKTHLPSTSFLVNGLLGAGRLIRAGRKKNQVLFATLEDWLPGVDLDAVNEAASHHWLAKKYLTVYGPSTVSELAHWAGWTVSSSKHILEGMADDLEEIISNGTSRYMISGTTFPEKENRLYLRVLHNDDEIHLSCSGRCHTLFGYARGYHFSTTAAVLENNVIIGEITIRKKKNTLTVEGELPAVDYELLEEQVAQLGRAWHATPHMRI